jgi:hypothetical protein
MAIYGDISDFRKHNTLEIVPISRANKKYSVTLHHATI